MDHCRDFLLSTEGKTLAEANPSDPFFGTGIGLRHPDVWKVDLWGKNLLAPVFSFTVKYCWASSLMSDIGVVCTVEPVILCTAIVALLIL